MSASSRMTFYVEAVAELSIARRSAMLDILSCHFDGITLEDFHRDLFEKDLALLLEQDGRLVGFSTMLAYSTFFDGGPLNVIYSGDTIVSPQAWGSTALPRAWVTGVRRLQATLPPGRCFWLLLSSGFRTYRFLSVFWREFFPTYSRPTPAEKQRLLAKLAAERFGNQFDQEAGIVRFRHPQRLRKGLKEVPTGREGDPHTEFFLRQNPGYAEGDELVCLAEICPENLTLAGRRMMPTNELASHHR